MNAKTPRTPRKSRSKETRPRSSAQSRSSLSLTLIFLSHLGVLAFTICISGCIGVAQSSRTRQTAKRDTAHQIDAKLALAASDQMAGHYLPAAEVLGAAEKLSQSIDDPRRRIAVLESLGCLYTLDPDLEQHIIATTQPATQPTTIDIRDTCACGPKFSPRDAYSSLSEALRLCQSIHDSRAEASVVINLGNYQSTRDQVTDAIDSYQRAGELAAAAGDDRLLALALADNAAANASASLEARENAAAPVSPERYAKRCADVAEQAYRLSDRLGESSLKSNVLVLAGQSVLRLHTHQAEAKSPDQDPLPAWLEANFQTAVKSAKTPSELTDASQAMRDTGVDRRALSYALGSLGRLYELQSRRADALDATGRAIAAAEQAQMPESVYRWQWQAGRLLRPTDLNASITFYREAVATLQSVRNDLALRRGNRSRETSFRSDVGQLYFDLADALFERAGAPDHESTPAIESVLIEARATVETLKSAELEDYFQDSCSQLLKKKTQSIEKVAPGTAIVYFIPLAQRLEILVNTSSGLHRYVSPVASGTLDAAVRQFRDQLVVQITPAYLPPARQLYQWLIRPIQPLLDRESIDTLVFVPDGSLATVPMAALENGHAFLIDRYAIAVTPGLTLIDPKPTARSNTQPLLSGLSVSVQGFDSLKFVPQELDGVQKVYGGHELLNEDFVLPNLKRELDRRPYSIVHVASHAQFGRDARQTFLLTYDGRIDLNELQNLLEPRKLGDTPVELLTLSACETAAGDDLAALGLAGAAVKSGARSVLATLWSVNDEAASVLITRFYSELRNDPSLSKAKALQRAQQALLRDPRYRYPLFWSPYLVIGNWL